MHRSRGVNNLCKWIKYQKVKVNMKNTCTDYLAARRAGTRVIETETSEVGQSQVGSH